MGLVKGDNTPRSSRAVQASSLQNNGRVVLSSVVRRSPGRLGRQLCWDPGTRARTRGGGVQRRVFLFFSLSFLPGRGVRVWSLEGLCVVGTPIYPLHPTSPPPNPQSFLTPKKGQCDRTAICNADHVQEEGKKKLGINGPVSIC